MPSQDPDGLITMNQLSKQSNVPSQIISVWITRHNFPKVMRQMKNGNRLFSPIQIDILKKFNEAGRPFSQLEGGTWLGYRCNLTIKEVSDLHAS